MANNHLVNNANLPSKTICAANNVNKKAFMDHYQAPATAKPLHVRRIEKAVNLGPFLNNFNKENDKQPSSSSSSSESDSDHDNNESSIEEMLRDEPHSVKDYFNLKNVSLSRQWLVDVLASENGADSEPEEAPYKSLLNMHAYQKKLRKNKQVDFDQSMFYGAGIISAVDHYPDIEREIVTAKNIKKETTPILKEESVNHNTPPLYYDPDILNDIPFKDEPCINFNLDNGLNEYPTFDSGDIEGTGSHNDFSRVNIPAQIIPIIPSNLNSMSSTSSSGHHHHNNHNHHTPSTSKRKSKKFKDEDAKRKWEEIMGNKRRKLFTNIVKKEVNKQHRAKTNKHKEMLLSCKRVASHCVKYARQKALQSARTVKEQQWRMKRLARESIAYWKRSRRFDREVKKRLEKEAEEQRKMDHELIEAKRQQRKLNFLITQTELYAHFMSKKLGRVSPEEQLRILSQLDEDESSPTTKLVGDNYNCEAMKEQAKRNAQEAFQSEKARTEKFDQQANSCLLSNVENIDGEQSQPEIFKGMLKGYQLKGMNWLANLYSQGISGILADEMGLGKTVQSIAFLCHIAEKYSVWGPFLIISPASTLHNWQQEIAKFVPDFKVVPYWGSPNERKILRQFWDQKDIYTKDASFHIVVTSYQIVITDIKYFNRIKWQYMILDEAQAIKSTSSMRWKTLLGFSCRNRLLLSGTPIQNSMAELWALLHFIMPTLFDSHDEFNEWFSKDIESHAENRTGIDEKHLSRLHMILKPFMLRRIKKDVENELSDKIEIMVYCPLTPRQNLLYMALKKKIKIEDLLHYTVGGGAGGGGGGGSAGTDAQYVDKNFTSNLMNLVMQFRKVCNHPELFERRDAKSPIRFNQISYKMPYLIYDTNVRLDMFSKLNIQPCFTAKYINEAMWGSSKNTLFNFLIFLNHSIGDFIQIFQGNILTRWKTYYQFENNEEICYLRELWHPKLSTAQLNCKYLFKLSNAQINNSNILNDIIFVRNICGNRIIYSHQKHTYHSMAETIEHRNIRYKKNLIGGGGDEENGSIDDEVNIPNFVHIPRSPLSFDCEKTELPSYLSCIIPKVSAPPIITYCYSRRAAWYLQRHIEDYSYNSLNFYWSQAIGRDFPIPSTAASFHPPTNSCIETIRPAHGWSNIVIPDKESLVTDSGKLYVLDGLLKRLKEEGHRVLIYSQMTRMIDLLEEYMWHRHHKYMRLDGSSKISERRDMVADFQARTDIFVFLLSTRAGGLGINLTAADTVIFYDSDWNPTVDQQAMDRAHRLGQTKQVTVYRLICKGSIEERILQRAREKSEIQKLVISGGNFKPDTLKPKEVVSLLLDDDELIQKYHLKVETKPSVVEDTKEDRKRKLPFKTIPAATGDTKKPRLESPNTTLSDVKDEPNSPQPSSGEMDIDVGSLDDHQCDQALVIEDDDSPITNKYTVYNVYGSTVRPKNTGRGQTKRGRPRGSRSRALTNSNGRVTGTVSSTTTTAPATVCTTTTVTTTTTTTTINSITCSSTTTTSGSTSSFGDNIDSSSSTQSSPRYETGGADNNSGTLIGNGTLTSRSRGPGRPRLRPSGPSHAGSRSNRTRKPVRPLPVPLHSDLIAQHPQQHQQLLAKSSFSISEYLDE